MNMIGGNLTWIVVGPKCVGRGLSFLICNNLRNKGYDYKTQCRLKQLVGYRNQSRAHLCRIEFLSRRHRNKVRTAFAFKLQLHPSRCIVSTAKSFIDSISAVTSKPFCLVVVRMAKSVLNVISYRVHQLLVA